MKLKVETYDALKRTNNKMKIKREEKIKSFE